MSASREHVLARVRAALADVPRDEKPEDVTVPDDYARSHDQGEPIGLLVDRLEDYKAVVHRVGAADLPAAVASAMAWRNTHRVVVPADLPADWTSQTATRTVAGDELDIDELDAVDGVITGCAVAIAETGTIVLDGGAGQGRRAVTLIPDYHLCVVRADQVVAGVPEAVARLDPRRPLTWISGPSATSDIELDRVEGVHGPRTLEVIIVE
ncbi:L-lactate dehydrogenase complex protein LldG [Spinactinospora alkalitolerans]|uniref:L-lactate dehydrogenase complex protein LldG n=1 Tax=Spinactinospora alkalitolerans TaxID=687207 RepID=A0A852TSC0_9ACTN|nr:lactate utilization protein C [Spinactinospora alkalitolerans]NYE47296.1 L-lactate dehydrogenase complex protein LldG [Spinactinospora alkalitolerans]